MTRYLFTLIAVTIPLLPSCVKRNPDISHLKFYHHYDRFLEENTLFILNDLPGYNVVRIELSSTDDTLYINDIRLVRSDKTGVRHIKDEVYNTVKLVLHDNVRHITYGGQTIGFRDIPLDTLHHPRSYRPCIFDVKKTGTGTRVLK